MNSSPITPADPDSTARHVRATVTAFAVLLALWCIQIRYPPLSYPETGLLELCTLCTILLAGAVLNRVVSPAKSNPAVLVGFVFVLYAVARWAWDGFAAVGATNLTTLLTAACYACAAYLLLSVYEKLKPASGGQPLLDGFLVVISLTAFVCAVHAIYQYLYIYDNQYARLQQDIGAREPTALELGLLHHFRAKRVASVWGDPNTLGCFLALSVAASISLLRRGCILLTSRLRFCPRGLCGASLLASLPALFLTQSRGAAIDLILVLILSVMGTRLLPGRRTIAAAFASLFILCSVHGQAPSNNSTAAAPGILTRSSTVRERMFYVQTGWEIIKRDPLFGSGWGGVDQYYGRYKPIEARETKYLHNWVLQTWAEAGLVGLALLGVTVLVAMRRSMETMNAASRTYWIMAAVFCLDALVQHSFNQRELMSFAGLVFGVLYFAGADAAAKRSGFHSVMQPLSAVILCILVILLIMPWLYGDTRKNRAQELLESGNTTIARSALRSAMRFTPQDPELYTIMSTIAGHDGLTTERIQWLRLSVSKRPESASLHAQLGRALFEAGNLPETEKEFRRSLAIYPGNAQYHYDMALLLERKGDLRGALAEAKSAVSLSYHVTQPYERYVQELEARIAAGATGRVR